MASGATGTYGLPYPVQTDPVDVAVDVQALATQVETQLLIKAPLASPTFTGIPITPTASNSDNSTQVATTAFVKNQAYATISAPTFIGTVTIPTLAVTGAATITSTISASGLAGSLLTATVGTTLGVAAAGTSAIPARSDHVHPTEYPTQTGNSGKFLTTSGSAVSWATVIGSVFQATAPAGPSTGAIWTDSDTNVLYQYDGAAWISPMGIETVTPTFVTNNYTLLLADQSRLLQLTNGATAGTLTIPLNSSVAYPIGTQIQLIQTAAGQITITPTGGVTLNGTPGLKLRTTWSSATIIKVAINSWIAIGDLSA